MEYMFVLVLLLKGVQCQKWPLEMLCGFGCDDCYALTFGIYYILYRSSFNFLNESNCGYYGCWRSLWPILLINIDLYTYISLPTYIRGHRICARCWYQKCNACFTSFICSVYKLSICLQPRVALFYLPYMNSTLSSTRYAKTNRWCLFSVYIYMCVPLSFQMERCLIYTFMDCCC